MSDLTLMLQQIENIKKKEGLLSVSRDEHGNLAIKPLPDKVAGMYWLYTNYTIEDLKDCTVSTDIGAIPIARIANLHKNLPHVSAMEIDGFKLVYNGIAGTGLGLRGRVHQHFNGGKGTGCLSITKSSVNNLDKWRVFYVTLDHKSNTSHNIKTDYSLHAKELERVWRLTYGWPLLCRT
jgi:hypothetical protein